MNIPPNALQTFSALFSMTARNRLFFRRLFLSAGRAAAIFTGIFLLMTMTTVSAQQQFQGWCAPVKMEILQEMTLERIGFEATLTVTNNQGQDAITDFFAELTFEDPSLSEDGKTNDASDFFFVRKPTMSSINAVDGSGVIGASKTATIRWFIIPKPTAGGTDPNGKRFRVGARIGGKLGGIDIPKDQMFVFPDTITVKPEPELDITYFLPRDVQGDNPFTPEVEPPVPFTLGVKGL